MPKPFVNRQLGSKDISRWKASRSVGRSVGRSTCENSHIQRKLARPSASLVTIHLTPRINTCFNNCTGGSREHLVTLLQRPKDSYMNVATRHRRGQKGDCLRFWCSKLQNFLRNPKISLKLDAYASNIDLTQFLSIKKTSWGPAGYASDFNLLTSNMESAFEIYVCKLCAKLCRSYWKNKISRCLILGTLWDELDFQISTSRYAVITGLVELCAYFSSGSG